MRNALFACGEQSAPARSRSLCLWARLPKASRQKAKGGKFSAIDGRCNFMLPDRRAVQFPTAPYSIIQPAW